MESWFQNQMLRKENMAHFIYKLNGEKKTPNKILAN